ncbi:aminopeptidase N [Thalassotalea sp. M1531]|uniref:Aminopeptidase N n=1 Tax=Thalassotalea algicola TaxID=2716224 RepID=A0A7Y0LC08_9GAMM|nr:aminopeptidase N [Thalassotalea algicola]NMP31439.1 aminopeptidase N [Thalassotalea algicola]
MSEFTARYLADYQPSPYSINTIDLTIELDEHATKVRSILSITKKEESDEPLVLDGEHLILVSVSLGQQSLSPDAYQLTEQSLTIFNLPSEFTLTVETEVDPANNTALEGLYKSGDAFCTQCEAEGFRRITYYLDRPDVMAIFTTKVIADRAKFPQLLANGNPVERGELNNNKHFVTWHDPHPKPCYLFALVAGDFDLLSDQYKTASGREVLLEIFVDKGNKAKAEHAMASLKHSMKWDEDVFGLEYDLDIYMIVAVDFFNMGAMENKGLNVFNSKYVLADRESATDTDFFNIEAVIAHEYFHNWTGNRVTCRDWFQLSLKEGLTVFRDQQFSADMHSADVTRIQNVKLLRAQQFAEDAGPMSHPIRPEKVMEMNNFYTLTVYEKGAEVIRMLHTLLGQNGFRKGMDLYFDRFDGMAVTCDDFVTAMADANNRDLTLFKRWYSQSGTPELTVTQHFESASQQFTLNIEQMTPATGNQLEKLALHIPIKLELIVGEEVQTQLVELTNQSQQFQFACEQEPTVAFLCDFSAPVKVNYEQSTAALLTIIESSQNNFCVWDAGQKIMAKEIEQLVLLAGSQPSRDIERMFNAVITADYDAAFKALMLTLPSFDEMTAHISKVDPQKLISAIEKLSTFISSTFSAEFLSLYKQHSEVEHLSSSQQVGSRALANTCLRYLVKLTEHHSLVAQRYLQATDMTTKLGALQCSIKQVNDETLSLLNDFEQQWHADTLVMDKWFSLNANLNDELIFERLEQLMARDDFALTNPNRARSLIGAFAMQNNKYFHESSGKGYQFLAQQIIEMDRINPQVASRLITPLIQFEAFNEVHQSLMISQLQFIASQDNLSRDLVEKLEAALKE